MSFIYPCRVLSNAWVVKSILWVSCGVNIQKHANLILKANVKHLFNFFGGPVHTSDIWVILIDGPITNGKTYSLDTSWRKFLDMVFSVPLVPMSFHPLVGVIWINHCLTSLSHDFTETVRVKCDIPLLLVEERVKERRRNPWFENHPSTKIGSLNSPCLSLLHSKECCHGQTHCVTSKFHFIK